MKKNKKIHWLRFKNNDDLLTPTDIRTYIGQHCFYFVLAFLFSVFVWHLIINASSTMGIDWALKILFTSSNEDYREWARDKIIFTSALSFIAGIFGSYKLTPKVTWTKLSNETKNLYFEDTAIANKEFHRIQKEQDNTLYESGTYLITQDDCLKPLNIKLNLIFKTFNFKFNSIKVKKFPWLSPVVINKNASILSKFTIGLAGSGKSVFFDYLYEAELKNGTKLIIHSPDQKARNQIASSGYTYAISAPWFKDSIYIDIFKTLDVEDINQQNALIDVIITSIHGYVDQSSDNAFFENGAVYILTASLRKVIHISKIKYFELQEKIKSFEEEQKKLEKNSEEEEKTFSLTEHEEGLIERQGLASLDLWIEELVNKSQIYQFKELVDVYYPEAGFTISEDAEKMTASIIASITKSLTNLGILNNFYKKNRKPFDLRKWCLDTPELDSKGRPLPEKQVIVLCGDKEYAEVSKINIALFINMASVFLLSDQREKAFIKNKVRVHQILDEFPNFAKNIEMNKWIEIINEGRKFGNIATIASQNTHQIASCLKGNKVDSQKFLGSFHTQIIGQPSPEDGDFIENICGEVTYKDKTATPTIDTMTGKKSLSYPEKDRVEKITWQKLQEDLGVQNQKLGRNTNKNIGVNMAIRLVGTNLTANLFFPFKEHFCKDKREELLKNGEIIKENGLEVYCYKDKFKRPIRQPLHFKERRIQLTEEEQNLLYVGRAIEAKEALMKKLASNKDLKGVANTKEQLAQLKKEDTRLKNQQSANEQKKNEEKLANRTTNDFLGAVKIEKGSEVDSLAGANKKPEEKEEKAEGLAETTSEILKETALHGLDHTGTLGALDNALTVLEHLESQQEDNGTETLISLENEDNKPKQKRKIIRKKENER